MQAIADDRLRAYYVWLPMLPTDDVPAAEQAAAHFVERRARHYWDGEKRLARRLGQALGVDPAWDIYLAHASGDVDVLAPRFWMHQLPIEHGTRLDANIWGQRLQELLELGR